MPCQCPLAGFMNSVFCSRLLGYFRSDDMAGNLLKVLSSGLNILKGH